MKKMYETHRVKLVGCNFANPSKEPKVNDVIKLKLEPDNKFDKNAIVVLNDNCEKIGYIGTNNTVSKGNKRNGCVDNVTLKSLLNFNSNDYLGIITKFKGYFGFIDITVIMDK